MGNGTLEKIVDGGFRALLICSAIYFGAKYSPYVMKIADKVKERIIHGSSRGEQIAKEQIERYRDPPESLRHSDPRLYNAILIDNMIQQRAEQSADFSKYQNDLRR